MTTRELTIAFEFAIALFAIYLLIRRLARLGSRRTPSFYIQPPREDPSREPTEFITIAWFELAEDAEKWAQRLDDQGIETRIEGGWPRGIEKSGPPQLQVRSKDSQQAIELLRHMPREDSEGTEA